MPSFPKKNTIPVDPLENLSEFLKLAPAVKRSPLRSIQLTYDQEADVLYVNFGPSTQADDTELTDDDIIIRYDQGEVVGLTILHVSAR